jgi:arginine deiminase
MFFANSEISQLEKVIDHWPDKDIARISPKKSRGIIA